MSTSNGLAGHLPRRLPPRHTFFSQFLTERLLRMLLFHMTCKHTLEGQFIRRIATPCDEFPRRCLWLIAEDPQKERMERECLQGIFAIHQILPPWHDMLFLCCWGPECRTTPLSKDSQK